MSRLRSNTRAAELPSAFRINVLRAGLVLGIAAALLAFAVREAEAQQASLLAAGTRAPVPFVVGEELVYDAKFSIVPAGTARMKVAGVDTIRGRAAYHVIYTLEGGIPFFRVNDKYESWIDVETLSSLRFKQDISEGRYHRNTTYEFFPERAEYQKNDEPIEPSVSNPLDDGSFIYAVRAMGVQVGDTISSNRYFQPDRNPVVLTGLRTDTVSVDAGTFPTIVVRPTIKAKGIFSENGDAQVWFTNDSRRIPVLVKSHFSKFSITLSLRSIVTP